MQNTSYYNLKKPELEDIANIEDLNDNADILDEALKNHDDSIARKLDATGGNISDTVINTVTASTASYPSVAAGDSVAVATGKVNKNLSDLSDKIDNLGANAATSVNLGFIYLNQADLAELCTYVKNSFTNAKPYAISTNMAIARILMGDSGADIATGVMVKQSATSCRYIIGRPSSNAAITSGHFNPSDSTQAPVIYTALNKGGTGNVENTDISTFTASTANYPVPAAGDTLKVALGKIVKFFSDIKGAITGLSISGKNITWSKADGSTGTLTTQDTTYTAGSGLTLSGTQFKHSNSVTAGTAGTSSATSGQNTLAVPYVTYDAQGHVTAAGTHTHTINTFEGCTADGNGKVGLVPQPLIGKMSFYLRADGGWTTPQNNLTTTSGGYLLDARQGKALNDKISNIKIITPVAGTYSSLANNTVNGIASLSLPAGTYLVIGNACTNVSATSGTLAGTVNTTVGLGNSPMSQAFNGTGASITCMWCYTLSATTNVYMVVRQTSGSAKDILYNLAAIRLS